MVSARLIVAGVAVLLLLASGSMLVVDALTAGSGGEEPVVGVPRHGDAVTYERHGTFMLIPPEVAPGEPAVAFFWNGTGPARDGYGREGDVDRLVRVTALAAREYAFAPGQAWPLTVDDHGFTVGSRTEAGADGERYRVQYEARDHVRAYPGGPGAPRLDPSGTWQDEAEAWFLCLARADWQGLTIAELPSRDARDLCPGAGFEGALQPGGEGVVAGIPVQWFTVAVRDVGEARVAFADGLAYPVEFAVRFAFGPAEDPVVTEGSLRLMGFEPGNGPVVRVDAEPPTDARRAEFLAPSTPHGPMARDFDIALTVEDAYAAWRGNESLGVHDWLDAHPDAALESVTLLRSSHLTPAWEFAFTTPAGEQHAALVQWPSRCNENEDACDLHMTSGPPIISGGGRSAPDGAPLTRTVNHPRGLILTVEGVDALHREWRVDPDAEWEAMRFEFGRTWSDGTQEAPVVRVGGMPDAGGSRDAMVFHVETGGLLRHAWEGEERVLSVTPASEVRASASTRSTFESRLENAPIPVPTSVYYVTSGVALVMLAAAAFAERLTSAGALMYTRLNREDVLKHPRREAIVDAIRERPGLSTSDVQNAIGLSKTAALYHLEVLVRERHLVRVQAHPFTRYYPAGHAPLPELGEDALRLNAGAEARVLDAVREEPGASISVIAARLDVTPAAVHRIVRRLRERGLVVTERDGRRVRLYASRAKH